MLSILKYVKIAKTHSSFVTNFQNIETGYCQNMLSAFLEASQDDRIKMTGFSVILAILHFWLRFQ